MAAMVESSPDEFTASYDCQQQIVIKRKRTKRPRPSSPFTTVTTTTTTTSSSSATAVAEFHGGESINLTTTTTAVGLISSPIVSSEITTYDESTVTEEEEDMANCLILLAQSGEYSTGSEKTKSHRKVNAVEKSPMMMMMGGGERGYVYECKTCNRMFNSFQALGGHRASHKRPKSTPFDHHHEPQLEPYNENLINDNHQYEKLKLKLKLNQIVAAAAATVKLPDVVTNHPNKLSLVSTKVHECSICGAEFSSGQALGGHMRRHRSLTTVPLTPITSIVAANEKCDEEQQQGRKILPLDLNLPAPEDNDHRGNTKFQFMFTSPALVDCHF